MPVFTIQFERQWMVELDLVDISGVSTAAIVEAIRQRQPLRFALAA